MDVTDLRSERDSRAEGGKHRADSWRKSERRSAGCRRLATVLLILSPVLAATAAYVYSGAVTPTYRADASVRIEPSAELRDRLGGDPAALQSSAASLARSWSGLPLEGVSLDRLWRSPGVRGSPRDLAEKVRAGNIYGTDVVHLTVEDGDEHQAVVIAAAVVAIFQRRVAEWPYHPAVAVVVERPIAAKRIRPNPLAAAVVAASMGIALALLGILVLRPLRG
jgi:capsular polysaccharide biosynthesis protein